MDRVRRPLGSLQDKSRGTARSHIRTPLVLTQKVGARCHNYRRDCELAARVRASQGHLSIQVIGLRHMGVAFGAWAEDVV